MKAILVLEEMAECCSRCRLQAYDNEGGMICAGERLTAFDPGNTSIYENYWNNTKPSWCPLKPLSEKIESEEKEK